LSLFPARDSWFFGDTICRIWVYVAAHKNHCYSTSINTTPISAIVVSVGFANLDLITNVC